MDYALGAEPHTGVFVIVYEEKGRKQKELAYFKMGDGPFYVFYTPFHLPHIQIASTIARAALLHDPTVVPLGGPVCEVVAVAKRDLQAGEVLDGIGGFMAYGTIDSAEIVRAEGLLPIGVAEGCRLARDILKDTLIRYDDVHIPPGRLVDQLRAEQVEHWPEPAHGCGGNGS